METVVFGLTIKIRMTQPRVSRVSGASSRAPLPAQSTWGIDRSVARCASSRMAAAAFGSICGDLTGKDDLTTIDPHIANRTLRRGVYEALQGVTQRSHARIGQVDRYEVGFRADCDATNVAASQRLGSTDGGEMKDVGRRDARHRAATDAAVSEGFSRLDSDAAIEALLAADIALARVSDMETLSETRIQTHHRRHAQWSCFPAGACPRVCERGTLVRTGASTARSGALRASRG